MEIQIADNILKLNGKEIKFDYKIRQFSTINDDVVVLLAVPNDVNMMESVYCYGSNGIIKWQVQPIAEAFPELKRVFPYKQMSIIDGELCATDFFGRRFFIDAANGRLIKKDTVK